MLFKKVGQASLITGLFTFLAFVLAVFTQSLIGRGYGPQGLGVFAACNMFINIFSLLSIFGIPSALSKFVAEFEERREHEKIVVGLRSVMLMNVFSSLIFGIISYQVLPYLGKLLQLEVPPAMALSLSAALFFYNITRLTQFYYQGLLQAFKSSLINITMFIVILLGFLYSVYRHNLEIHFIVLFGCLGAGAVGLFFYLREQSSSKIFFSKEIFSQLMIFSLPIALSSHLYFISQWVDRFVLGFYMGVTQIGLFTAAFTITQGILQIPLALSMVLLPSFSKAHVHGQETMDKAFNLTFKFLSLALFLGGLITLFFARDMIQLLYGDKFEQFQDAVLLLQILSVNIFLSAFIIPASNVVTGIGKPQWAAWISFLSLLIQTGLIIFFTKIMAINGAAIGRGIALGLMCLMYLVMMRKIPGMKINWLEQGKIACLTVVCALIFILGERLCGRLVSGVIICLIYSVCGWSWILKPRERELLQGFFLKVKVKPL